MLGSASMLVDVATISATLSDNIFFANIFSSPFSVRPKAFFIAFSIQGIFGKTVRV